MANEIGYEGFPSVADNNRLGSATGELRDDIISIPAGMSSAGRAARVNMHQNESEAKVIGVPGSTYHQHKSDVIHRSVGGHAIIFGNAPGAETLHIQGKGGQVIEMSNDGSVRITAASGLHMSIGGDGQIVLSGDVCISTNGDFRLKCGTFHLDCTDVNVMASGNKTEHFSGDVSSRVIGDSHSTVGGDKSAVVGGDHREIVAGNSKSQVAGERRMHTKGKHESSSEGDMMMETKGKMSAASEGDFQLGSQAKMSVQAETDFSMDAKGNTSITADGHMSTSAKQSMTQVAGNTMVMSSKGAMTAKADGAQTFQSKAAQSLVASGTTSIHSGGEIVTAAAGALRSSSASGTAYGTTNPSGGVISAITPNTPSDADSPRDSDTNVADAKPQVPDEKTILALAQVDLVETDGKVAYVDNEQGLLSIVDEGEEIPANIKSVMKKRGLDEKTYVASLGSEKELSDTSPRFADGGSDWINPLA